MGDGDDILQSKLAVSPKFSIVDLGRGCYGAWRVSIHVFLVLLTVPVERRGEGERETPSLSLSLCLPLSLSLCLSLPISASLCFSVAAAAAASAAACLLWGREAAEGHGRAADTLPPVRCPLSLLLLLLLLPTATTTVTTATAAATTAAAYCCLYLLCPVVPVSRLPFPAAAAAASSHTSGARVRSTRSGAAPSAIHTRVGMQPGLAVGGGSGNDPTHTTLLVPVVVGVAAAAHGWSVCERCQ